MFLDTLVNTWNPNPHFANQDKLEEMNENGEKKRLQIAT